MTFKFELLVLLSNTLSHLCANKTISAIEIILLSANKWLIELFVLDKLYLCVIK